MKFPKDPTPMTSPDHPQGVEADKVMTPEEYAALKVNGWHSVCQDVDGFGGVGVRWGEPALISLSEGVDHGAVPAGWLKQRVAEIVAEGDGFWLSCSGCYETSDGYNVQGFPFSAAFKAIQGGGCRECGGLGVIWDTTDYEAMGRELSGPAAAPKAPTTETTVLTGPTHGVQRDAQPSTYREFPSSGAIEGRALKNSPSAVAPTTPDPAVVELVEAARQAKVWWAGGYSLSARSREANRIIAALSALPQAGEG